MAYQEFDEFPDLIEYYTTIGNGTLLKEEYTTIKECTLLQDIEHFLYLTQSYFSDVTPNQILHHMSTLISWSKTFYTTTGQYPTLYDYLAITREDLIRWEYYLINPNTSVKPNIFRSTLIPPSVYHGEVSHHMRDSVETYVRLPRLSYHQYDVSVHMSLASTVRLSHHNVYSPSVCQPHGSPVCHTTMATCLSVRQSYTTSDHHTNLTTSPLVCQSRQSSVRCTIELTRPPICQRQYTSVCHTINTTRPSICQTHETSVHHAMKMNSLSICQPHDMSVRHTDIMTSPSVCPSKQLSDRHTKSKTSQSLCQSCIPSVCHNVIQTSPSVCQSRDSSVCYPTHDIRHTVCSSSVMSVLPSANPMVKMPMSIPIQNLPHE